MKCLSIQQPWASLICGGIKDVENRSWRVNDAPGRILIHAGKSMRFNPEENPLFFEILMSNATTCGYIPELADMPMGAIIGYADIVGFTEECTSDWAQEGHGAEWKWQIENAKLFKKPIPYRGRQGLFDVPELDADNLPEAYDFPKIQRNDMTIEIPVNAGIFDTLDEYESVQIYLTETNRPLFADDELVELPTQTVVFVNAATGKRRQFELDDIVIEPVIDEDSGEPVLFYDPNGNELELYTVELMYQIILDKDLKL